MRVFRPPECGTVIMSSSSGSQFNLARRKVIEAFASDKYGPGYLSIEQGEVVRVNMTPAAAGGWVHVVNTGFMKGWVPTNYTVPAPSDVGGNTGVDIQSLQQLLDVFRHLIGSLMKGGHLLTHAELMAGRGTGDNQFNTIENAGDNFMSKHEADWAMHAFEVLGVFVQHPLATNCAGSLHSNCEFGPFFAEALGLFDYFQATVLNPEVVAGMLEAVMGGLERMNLRNVLEAFVSFGISVLVAICVNGGDVVQIMSAIMKQRPDRCIQLGCGKWAAHVIRDLSLVLHDFTEHTKLKIAQLHKSILLDLTLPKLRILAHELVEIAPFIKTDPHKISDTWWRWSLQCIDCAEQYITPYGLGDSEALSTALAAGWGKATSSNWPSSCRCPKHHMAARGLYSQNNRHII